MTAAERVLMQVKIQRDTRYRLGLQGLKQHRQLSEMVEEALRTWLDRVETKGRP